MISPRTPKDVDTARDTSLKGGRSALWPFFEKGMRALLQKPVDISYFYAKSLILEATPSTGWGRFSTGCFSIYTVSPVFSTDAVFRSTPLLSLLIIEKEEEIRATRREKQETAIHGFLQLIKKASTGFHPLPTGFRGIRGLCFDCLSMSYKKIMTHPRIHGWKCVWVFLKGLKMSQGDWIGIAILINIVLQLLWAASA